MILVLLGTQNNSFCRLLEEIEKNIKNGNITDKVIVQAGHTKFKSDNMEIFDLIPQGKLDNLIKDADLIITHGGVGSIMAGARLNKKIIAVPRLKKYGEHVNDHQLEIIDTFRKQGIILAINDVSELEQALKNIQDFKPQRNEVENAEMATNKIIQIIDKFIQNS